VDEGEKNKPKKVVNVIIPKPPNCIKNSIIVFPMKVNEVAVSIGVSPVTQTADVEVKNALVTEIPWVVAVGNNSIKPPAIINNTKLSKNSNGGLKTLKKLMFLFENSIKKMMAFIEIKYNDSKK
jgi:hypothetical protein